MLNVFYCNYRVRKYQYTREKLDRFGQLKALGLSTSAALNDLASSFDEVGQITNKLLHDIMN